jgi:putative component of toxin-antitoxin plasmid stabilization module
MVLLLQVRLGALIGLCQDRCQMAEQGHRRGLTIRYLIFFAELEFNNRAAGLTSGATQMITYMLLARLLDVREYVDANGRSPFTKWLRALNVHAAAKVATALERIADGSILARVTACILDGRLVILLAGGTKKRQQLDVRHAQMNWEDYRKRKTQEKKDGTDQRLS